MSPAKKKTGRGGGMAAEAKKAASKKAASKKAASKKGTSKKGTSKKGTSKKAKPRARLRDDSPLSTPTPRIVRIGGASGPSVRDLQTASLPTTVDGWKKVIAGMVAELTASLAALAAHDRSQRGPDPVAGPPASARQLAAYEEFLTCELPPSYRAFLELHDGYRGLNLVGDFLSSADAMPGGRFYRRILVWKKDCARYGAYEVLDGIVVADSQNVSDWVFIDPNHVSNGLERLVVKWSPSFETKYSDVSAYLQSRVEFCRAAVREEKLA